MWTKASGPLATYAKVLSYDTPGKKVLLVSCYVRLEFMRCWVGPSLLQTGA